MRLLILIESGYEAKSQGITDCPIIYRMILTPRALHDTQVLDIYSLKAFNNM